MSSISLELRPLTVNDSQAFFEGLSLFLDMDPEWYSFAYKAGMSFEELLSIHEDEFHGRKLQPGRVAHSMLYAFYDGKIVGRASIRHDLNDYLMKIGGNIGYAVATSYRNRGIASEILKQALAYCRDVLKLKKVLVTCDEDNGGSIKTILKNGGAFENKILNEGKTTHTNRYWIKL
jgi:predicted acetyltransferase